MGSGPAGGGAVAVSDPRPRRAPRRRRPLARALGGSGARWLLAVPLLFVLVMLSVPLGFLVYESLQPGGTDRLGIVDAANDTIFHRSIVRTLALAAFVSALAVVIGTVYAIAMAMAPKWLLFLLVAFLFTIFWTSLLVRTYGWMLLYLPLGPIHSILKALGLREEPIEIFQTTAAAYPAMVHVMLPYVVLPVYAAARQVDVLQLRAARVLGARDLLVARKVVLPQLSAGIIAGGVLVFISSLGFYVTPQLLGDPTAPMVAGMIGNAFNVPDGTPAAAAMSVMLLTVVIALYFLADRLFRVTDRWGR